MSSLPLLSRNSSDSTRDSIDELRGRHSPHQHARHRTRRSRSTADSMSAGDTHTKALDNGVEIIETVPTEPTSITAEEDARVRRKIDTVLMPLMFVTYCLQFLDKSTLSYASVFDLVPAAHLVGSQYSWLGSIVYVAQLVCQPLIAYALVKAPLGKFLGIMVFFWGSTLCGMVAATEFKGLLAARFFLGAFESSIAPTFIAATQTWYKRSEQTNRNAIWYSTVGIINMFGSLIAYGLAHIPTTHLHTYQIIFLFCGSITVVFSVVVILFMPDSIRQAVFLSGADKRIAEARVSLNQQGTNTRRIWRSEHVFDAAKDVKTFLWFALLFSISIPSGGITTFGPLIVSSFGYTGLQSVLFYMPFGFIQFVATLGSAWLATRFRARGAVLAAFCVPPLIGCAILMAVDHVHGAKGVLLFGYYMIAVYPAITPLIYSWSAANTAGDTKRKVVTGVLFVGQSAGNIIGPTLYSTEEKPQYTRGLVSNLVLFIVLIVLAGLTSAWIRVLDGRHERLRSVKNREAAASREGTTEQDGLKDDNGVAETRPGDEGIGRIEQDDDRTDLENENFVFVY